MRSARLTGSLVIAFAAAMAVAGGGCAKQDPPAAKNKAKDGKGDLTDGKVELAKGDHSGWWCQEHGIPEKMCSLCSEEVATRLKKERDWCKIHDRAQSQCFKCDPGLYKKFEAMYVAKYNKKPEPPPKEEFQK
jgi:hypothetical protein